MGSVALLYAHIASSDSSAVMPRSKSSGDTPPFGIAVIGRLDNVDKHLTRNRRTQQHGLLYIT